MSLLQFMPWCPINQTHHAGEISIIPFDRNKKSDDLDELTTCQIRTVLSSYKNLEGHPVEEGALIKYGDKPILADLNEDEIEITRECVDLFCFSGLANREYFNQLGAYCNTDCFTLYGQKFADDPSFMGLTSRRREGRNINGRALAETTFTIPVHASSIRKVRLDEKLLSVLINYRDSSLNTDWSRWQNAISCFNQANTDNDTVRYQVEWVLLSSAFEHLLGAKTDAKDVAKKFSHLFNPASSLLIKDSKRKSERWKSFDSTLRYEWMREFYRIRGDFAHGKLKSRQPMAWEPLEHIVLATIALPLLVKILLSKDANYKLTNDDLSKIEAFEKIADEDFLKPPPERKSSIDSWVSRLTMEDRRKLTTQKIVKKLESNRALKEDEEKDGKE